MSKVTQANSYVWTKTVDSAKRLPGTPRSQSSLSDIASYAARDVDGLRDATIMLVDDEPINLEVTQIYLEEAGYTNLISTSDPTTALRTLNRERPDVLLLDVKMPAISGFEILEEMRSTGILKDVPTIILTASSDPETKLRALELGATDFLSKPVDPSELVLRIRNTLAAKAYRDRLANYDRLTGLPNRRNFIEQLGWAIDHSHRYMKKPGAVLLVDLDGFKQVNDALGPATGDALLRSVADRIGECLFSVDTLGRVERDDAEPSLSRMAGDEYAVLLPVLTRPDSAAQVAQRILESIAQPFSLLGHELQISCGIGIAVFPGDGTEADSIVRNASVAMHHAKRQRKNSYQFYSHELNARALHYLKLGNQLHKALERDELRLFYQPKVNIQTGMMCGCEALMRWQHPQRGLVEPDEFIEMAEEIGLIHSFGEWVIRTACRQSNSWRSAGLGALRISVNVSTHQILEAHLAATLRKILAETGADPSSLIVEITEGALLKNAETNIKVLQNLKDMGIKLSIDDFGTGYSSLSYLNSFPLDELKIDRSFVAQIKKPGDHSAIIAAIIAMAHSMGLSVVAEGVETSHQLEFLKKLQCDEYQGFMVSKPLPAEQFVERFLPLKPEARKLKE